MASSTRVEKLQYKEIPTPSWRVNEVGDDAAAVVVATTVAAKVEASFDFDMNLFFFFLRLKYEVLRQFLACCQIIILILLILLFKSYKAETLFLLFFILGFLQPCTLSSCYFV